MKKFMFVVTVLFAVLAIAAVILGIGFLASGSPVGGIIGLVVAAVLAIMSTSVARSLREV